MTTRSFTPNDHQIRMVLENLMHDLGIVAQSVVNKMNIADEKTKAATYVKIITHLIDNVSKIMKELNRLGVEKIRREYSLAEKLPDNKGIIV